jgi:RHS repeat-associated protein
MAAEAIHYNYDDLRQPTTTGNGVSSYVTKSTYSPTGKPEQYELSTGGKKTWLTYSYEYGTQRLAESRTDRENIAGVDRDATYKYYDAGNVKSVTDTSRSGTDTQCFSYDYLQRLSESWTPTNGCDATPDKTMLGGPAPYWSSYTYDSTGNRTKEIQHGVGAVTTDTTRTYAYPDPGKGQHQLTSVTQTGAAGNRTDSFGYDASGNTTSRAIGNAGQSLAWDVEGHLATTTDSAGTTGYAYDADGNRLLRRDPTSTTLYLPNMELRLDKTTGKVNGTRYYTHNGALVAMRTSTGVEFLASDPHGSADLSVDAATQTESQRRFTPFGQFRGSPTGIWPNDKGFVGGTIDPSGLTHLGVREYDPSTGRFISADPVFDPSDPQSWNGYAYADNNPATQSDPSGLHIPTCQTQGECDDDGGTGGNHSGRGGGGGGHHSGGGGGSFNSIVHKAWNFTVGAEFESLAVSPVPAFSILRQIPGAEDWIAQHIGADPDSDSYKWGSRTVDIAIAIADIGYGLKELAVRATLRATERAAAKAAKRATADAVEKQSAKAAAKEAAEESTPKDAGRPKARCNSFVAGTQVLLANGLRKAIEDVKVGDKVLATDPKTGKTQAQPVIASFGGTNYKNLIQITIDTDGSRGHRTGRIIATEHHEFWDQNHHRWIRANHLTSDSYLRTPGGNTVRVLRAASAPGHPTVRDLTVASRHTYYVEAGTTPILVHNSDCGPVSKYEDITRPRARMKNVQTDVGPTEFAKNLEANGWTRVERGPKVEYQKDGARYFLREEASTYEGWTVDYYRQGSKKPDIKIRLGED